MARLAHVHAIPHHRAANCDARMGKQPGTALPNGAPGVKAPCRQRGGWRLCAELRRGYNADAPSGFLRSIITKTLQRRGLGSTLAVKQLNTGSLYHSNRDHFAC